MTKQRRWQIKNNFQGLCIICGEEKITGTQRCKTHLVANRQRMRLATGSQKWEPGSRGRPPKYVLSEYEPLVP